MKQGQRCLQRFPLLNNKCMYAQSLKENFYFYFFVIFLRGYLERKKAYHKSQRICERWQTYKLSKINHKNFKSGNVNQSQKVYFQISVYMYG